MTRERLFGILWRLAILALPWQTRWIFSVPNINGFPWEQGTAAVYASWILLIATVLVGARLCLAPSDRDHGTLRGAVATTTVHTTIACLFSIGLLIVSSLFTSSLHATLFWWSHVILLTAFAWTLIKNHVPATSLALWFVLSLIPHAALGVWQFWSQHVFASTLLGIASQFPADSGVSVVETAQYRILRVYGGFPHPNIFGAWLAAGLTMMMVIIQNHARHPAPRSPKGEGGWRASTGWRFYGLITCSILFTFVLVLTFSRGAWIAAVIGIVISLIAMRRNLDPAVSGGRTPPCPPKPEGRRGVACVAIIILTAAMTALWQWPAVSTRFTPSARLESWSLTQRTSAIQDGLTAWRAHPVFGWGPGAGLIGISLARITPSPVPLEPPHVVPLVVLLETGIVGVAALLVLIGMLVRFLLKEQRFMDALPLIGILSILALTDHAFWTLWPGQTLLMVLMVFILRNPQLSEKEP